MDLRSSLAKLHDFVGADGPKSSWWRRTLWNLAELGPLTYQKMRDDKAPQMAAALTFHTLFSLLPTLVLTLVVAKAFVTEDRLQNLKVDTVDWTLQWLQTPADAPPPEVPASVEEIAAAGAAVAEVLPGNLEVPQEEATPPAAVSPFGGFLAAAREAAEQATAEAKDRVEAESGARLKQEFDETAAKLDQSLQELLDRLQNISLGSIGVAGVLLFIYGATALLSTIEDSFNFILRSPGGRPWYWRLVLYYSTLTLAPVVLVGGQVAQQTFLEALESGGEYVSWTVPLLSALFPLVATWAVLFTVYKLLPNGSIALVPALIGSLVSTVALLVTTFGFGIYVRNTGTTSLYGALAILPLFLMLLWIIWQIVLFGLELASVIRVLPAHRKATAWGRADPLKNRAQLPDPRLLIPVAVELAERFSNGLAATPRELAERVGLPADTLQVLLDRLVERGDAHRLPGEDPGYTLARPAAAIPLPALLDETINMGRRGTAGRAEDLLAELDDAERRAVAGRTLENLLPPSAPPPPEAPQTRPDAVAAPGPPAPPPTRRFRLPWRGNGRPPAKHAEPPEPPDPPDPPDPPEPPEPPEPSSAPPRDTEDAGEGVSAKGERRDSNPRPSGSQPDALTN